MGIVWSTWLSLAQESRKITSNAFVFTVRIKSYVLELMYHDKYTRNQNSEIL
jgi:hypothetical protein